MSESNKEFDPRNQSVDAAIAKGDEKERYVQAALENLRATSRTATGVVDTSASVGKAEKMASGLTPEQTAERALNNFTEAISYLYENKDRQFNESGELRVFVETVAQKINTGITKEGVLLRAEDSDKFPYTRIQDLESAMEQFYQELLERLSRPDADPKEIAAFVEYRIDLTDHFFADGCGKTANAISTWSLMRQNHALPKYKKREEYQYAPTIIRGQDPKIDEEQWQRWLEYYKSLFE
jgi:hypothetical protein